MGLYRRLYGTFFSLFSYNLGSYIQYSDHYIKDYQVINKVLCFVGNPVQCKYKFNLFFNSILFI